MLNNPPDTLPLEIAARDSHGGPFTHGTFCRLGRLSPPGSAAGGPLTKSPCTCRTESLGMGASCPEPAREEGWHRGAPEAYTGTGEV